MTLQRRTPLTPGTGLPRGKPLTARTQLVSRSRMGRDPEKARAAEQARRQRSRARQAATAPEATETRHKPTPRRTGPTDTTQATVDTRDRGTCVRCGAPAADRDHRSGRGAGGRKGAESDRINTPAWLLLLCGQGNTSGCHGWKETHRDAAEREGFRLPRNGPRLDATRVPVRTADGWALFGDDGTRRPCPAPPGGDAREVWPHAGAA